MLEGAPPRIATFGDYDQGTYEQIVRCAGADGYGVLCADNHLGYSQPIGGAVAYTDHISPSGVGYDIGCGNKAVRTHLKVEDVDVPAVMDEIVRRISFGMGRPNNEPVDHAVLDEIKTAALPEQRQLLDRAAAQLGTVGGGNHYVDLFGDEEGFLWIGVHFGSRGFGHKTASGFLALAQGKGFTDRASEGGMDAPPTLIPTDTELGQAYIEAMNLAGDYAYAGRDVVVNKVLEILGTGFDYHVHNHHNFAWRELHPYVHSEPVWVIRKGCTPAFPAQEGFVGGSMSDVSVILKGRDDYVGEHVATEDAGEKFPAVRALFSTVHGAGRQMSRNVAAGKQKRRKYWECSDRDCAFSFRAQGNSHPKKGTCPDHPDAKMIKRTRFERVTEGAINWTEVQGDMRSKGIELRGGAADEAPGAYKRLPEVLAAHSESIEIIHNLTPVGVAMAGAGVGRDD